MESRLWTRWGLATLLVALSVGGCSCGESSDKDVDPSEKPDGGSGDGDDGDDGDGDTGDGDTGDGDTGDGDAGDGDTGDGDTGDGDTGDGDTGDGDAEDPCAYIDTPCEEVSVVCDGDVLVTCVENDDGCLEETRRDCDGFRTDFCDDSQDPPVCARTVDPCDGVENPCDEAGSACDGPDLVTCAEDENGCLVETTVDCAAADETNLCVDGDDGPACAFDKCKNGDGSDKQNVCAMDQTVCSANVLVTCVDDTDGCPIATRTDCTTASGSNICDAGLNPPACAYDPCLEVTSPCLTAGTACAANTIVTCAADTDGCLVESVMTCATGQTCDDTGGTPMCTACSDDLACSAGAGTTCAGSAIQTCADSDGDGCLDVALQDCGGTDFVCCDGDADPTGCPVSVSETSCVYAGSDICLSEITQVLTTMASYPGNTAGGVNDYGNYACPGLFAPLAGAAEDLLFALDIPASSVVTVTLTQPEGDPDFSGNGAWLMLLSGCDDTAACQGITRDRLEFTNEATTASRMYLSVDADPADNSGDFGIAIDTRPFACGDGRVDGSEGCDDGNIFPNDGCTADCTLEEGYACTGNDPSVCTRRPTDNVCGNVQCPALPDNAPGGSTVCCSPDEQCGVTLSTYYGSGCFVRDQTGTDDEACPDAESVFALFFPTLPGCCRTDGQCGLRSATGAGCVERSELWLNMQDGLVGAFYSGPFESIACGQ